MSDTKVFILYDGRARCGNTDDATVLTTASTEKECFGEGGNYGSDSIWFEYDESIEGGDVVLRNPRMRLDLSINPKYPSAKQRGGHAR